MELWPESWADVLIPEAPLAELVVRGSAIYLFLYALMRVAGRRLLGQLSISDMLMIILLAVAVQGGMIGIYRTVGDAMISAGVILGWEVVVDRLAFRSEVARRILRPAPRKIIEDGQLLVENARASLLTRTEIMAKLRQNGVSSYDEVEEAYLESDGNFTVVSRGG